MKGEKMDEFEFVHDGDEASFIFDEAWRELAEEGKVDSLRGSQYRRLYMKWKEEGKDMDDSIFDTIYELVIDDEWPQE